MKLCPIIGALYIWIVKIQTYLWMPITMLCMKGLIHPSLWLKWLFHPGILINSIANYDIFRENWFHGKNNPHFFILVSTQQLLPLESMFVYFSPSIPLTLSKMVTHGMMKSPEKNMLVWYLTPLKNMLLDLRKA